MPPYRMPSYHAPDKETISFYYPRTLVTRLKKKAKKRGETLAQFVLTILTKETADIVLSPADYEAIAQATRLAEKSRRRGSTRL